jgi:deoxyribodipyrimidine photo-lyase
VKTSSLALIQNCWRLYDNPFLSLDYLCHFIGNIDHHHQDIIHQNPRRSKQFINFALTCAFEFQQQLQEKYQKACPVFFSDPVSLVDQILENNPQIDTLYLEEALAHVEKNRIIAIKQNHPQLKIHCLWTNSLFHPDDINIQAEDFKRSFSYFRKKVEKKITPNICHEALSPPICSSSLCLNGIKEMKTKPALQESSIFTPGEEAGVARVNDYLFKRKLISSYKLTRNNLLGIDYSSKFSPWLAHGALSPRWIYHQISKYEVTVEKNESTYWLKFELLWREFFRHAMFCFPRDFFLSKGLRGKNHEPELDINRLKEWTSGTTQSKFINAFMIELNHTGYMSNRGRQITASFLIHELNQPWRLGAAYFESQLIDYDVSSNWCNWAYLAGAGNDPRSRQFNYKKQQKTYDPDGEFIRFWLDKRR